MSDGKGEGAIKDENVGVNINLLNDMMSAMRVMQETLNNATIMKEAHGVKNEAGTETGRGRGRVQVKIEL